MQDAVRTRGEVIRSAREAKPWTQAQLGDAAGVSTRTIMRVERDEDTSAETLLSLCAALDIPASALPRPSRPQAAGPGQAPTGDAADAPPPPLPAESASSASPDPDPASGLAPSVEDGPAGPPRMAARAWRALSVCSAVLSLTTIGLVVGLQLAWSTVTPHLATSADALEAVIASVRAKQLNMLTVRYSTFIPADAPERRWDIWQERPHLSWSTCDRLGEGILSGYVRLASAIASGSDGCKEVSLDIDVVRRDDAMTEVVVGPLDARYFRGVLSSLTGDPSVRIQAIRTADRYAWSETDTWVDPRTTPIDDPGGKPAYARIRFSGNR